MWSQSYWSLFSNALSNIKTQSHHRSNHLDEEFSNDVCNKSPHVRIRTHPTLIWLPGWMPEIYCSKHTSESNYIKVKSFRSKSIKILITNTSLPKTKKIVLSRVTWHHHKQKKRKLNKYSLLHEYKTLQIKRRSLD